MKYTDSPAFCAVYPLILQVEGKYADLEGDSGGPTMYGISWNYNAGALSALGYTRDTMRTLKLADALQIYFDRYWVASGANVITDAGLGYIHLDAAINCGPGQAKKFLSRLSVNPAHFDGRGNRNSELFLGLVLEYEMQRMKFYTQDVSEDQRRRFLKGWKRRMQYVSEHAEKLVAK